MPFELVKPIIDMTVRSLCQKPYPGHPKGCPNYNRKKGCPPGSLPISKLLNLDRKIYVNWNEFNFHQHCKRMRHAHPMWTERQVRCCLYWQGKARKQLQNEIYKFRQCHPNYCVLYPPESHGVNVTGTMKRIGIELEWPPMNFAYQVAIAGKGIR